MIRLSAILFLLSLSAVATKPPPPPAGSSKDVAKPTDKPVEAKLICGVRSFAPGDRLVVGIALKHQPGFHTYWHSPGTVGLATMVDWKLPDGYEVSELSWPVPERCLMEGYNTHGYNRDVTLLATVTTPKTAKPGPVEFKAKLAWMACSKSKCCNLQYAAESLKLICGGEVLEDSAGKAAVVAAQRELPQAYAGISARFSDTRDSYELVVELKRDEALPPAKSIYFYGDGQLVNSIEKQRVERTAKGYRLTLPRTDYGPEDPQEMTGLLYTAESWPGTDARHLPVEAKRLKSPAGKK